VTRVQRVDNQSIGVLNPSMGTGFLFSTPLRPLQPPIQLLEVNHVGHKADNLPACTAEVKNVTGREDVGSE